jgi:hypothetical protein
MTRFEFVFKVGELLAIAKPNLMYCMLETGADIVREHAGDPTWSQRHPQIVASEYDEWVVVTCENGYKYFVPVSANSLAAIASAVFEYTMYK